METSSLFSVLEVSIRAQRRGTKLIEGPKFTGPKKFVIVGGGTAGWMAASTLARLFAAHPETGHSVILVESEAIGTVGVGEATIPTILDFVSFLKVDIGEFIRRTNATMKLGIKFSDWLKVGESYWHPFGTLGPTIENRPLYNYWLAQREQGQNVGGLMDLSPAIQLAERGKFAAPSQDPQSPFGGLKFALHFDAVLVAAFLREYAEAKGCRRIEGMVVDAVKSSKGDIESIRLKSGQIVEGDFFIDCSGFHGLLIEKQLGSPFEDWSKWLPNDRAIAAPTAKTDETDPYTISTARSAGWTWKIPLQSRVGNGYVYSSRFISDDDARVEFLASLNGNPLAEPRVLCFTGGMRREIWRGNCLSLGLASGFLEPLESTAIHLVFINLFRFLDHFPSADPDPTLIREFNTLAADEMEEIRDFLVLHYCLTDRQDSDYWRHWNSANLPASLEKKLSLFERNGRILSKPFDLFTNVSWVSVFEGMGARPKGFDPLTSLIPRQFQENAMADLRRKIAAAADAAVNHDAFLRNANLVAQ